MSSTVNREQFIEHHTVNCTEKSAQYRAQSTENSTQSREQRTVQRTAYNTVKIAPHTQAFLYITGPRPNNSFLICSQYKGNLESLRQIVLVGFMQWVNTREGGKGHICWSINITLHQGAVKCRALSLICPHYQRSFHQARKILPMKPDNKHAHLDLPSCWLYYHTHHSQIDPIKLLPLSQCDL